MKAVFLSEDLLTCLIFSMLFVGSFLVIYKHIRVRQLRNARNIVIKRRVFSFYKDEEIYRTNSLQKRNVMIEANRLTAFIYACFLPASLMMVIRLVVIMKAYLDEWVK